MKLLLIFCGLILASAGVAALARSDAPPLHFDFPKRADRVSSDRVSSASNKLAVTYKDPGPNESGGHDYRFSVVDRRNHELAGLNFDHSVDGQWTASSDVLFVNDHRGPGASDCFILKKGATGFVLQSLTDVMVNNPKSGIQTVNDPRVSAQENIKPPETPANSEYYMTCSEWIEPHVINVILNGRTDAGGEFKYDMKFDIDTGRFAIFYR